MAKSIPRMLRSSFPSNFVSPALIYILLATQPCSLYAQSENPPTSSSTSSTPSTTVPASVSNSVDGNTSPSPYIPSSVSSAIPSATDSAGYGDHDDSNTSSHNGILNYYFLLLAVFVIATLIIYWTLARRRRRAAAQLNNMQQRVLSEDVRSWTRHRQAGYGFEDEERRPGREEGLDEAGEAPPAYVKEPERVHLERGEGVELRGMARSGERAGAEGKPPDYQERLPPR